LACRTLDPAKILLVGSKSTPRLLLNGCGVFDVLTFSPTQVVTRQQAMVMYQQDDLLSLGKIVIGKNVHDVVWAYYVDLNNHHNSLQM